MPLPHLSGLKRRAALAALALLLALAQPALASAQGAAPQDPSVTEAPAAPAPLAPAAPAIRPGPSPKERQQQVQSAIARQLQGGQGTIHLYQLVEEMVDELVHDLHKRNPHTHSPAAVRAVTLTPNLSASFGTFVESTLVSAVSQNTHLALKRCIACQSLRSRVEGGDWVVSLGLTRHEDLVREAQALGVVSFLDARLAFFPETNTVVLQAEITRASDGAVLWTEAYRSDATTAAILRSGDRVVGRAERVEELERKLEARPYYGHALYGGVTHIPLDAPTGGLTGASIGYRLYERFGEDRRNMFGIGAEAFANFSDNGLLGSFVHLTLQRELLAPNLNRPTLRTGPAVGGFFAGTEGNSFSVEWALEAVLQFRLGIGASAMYFVPTKYLGYDLGGAGYKLRAMFNW